MKRIIFVLVWTFAVSMPMAVRAQSIEDTANQIERDRLAQQIASQQAEALRQQQAAMQQQAEYQRQQLELQRQQLEQQRQIEDERQMQAREWERQHQMQQPAPTYPTTSLPDMIATPIPNSAETPANAHASSNGQYQWISVGQTSDGTFVSHFYPGFRSKPGDIWPVNSQCMLSRLVSTAQELFFGLCVAPKECAVGKGNLSMVGIHQRFYKTIPFSLRGHSIHDKSARLLCSQVRMR